MKKKIGIVYSSFNNYEILENEVFKRVNFEGYPVINIDDHSDIEDQKIGEQLCIKNNIYFEINKKKGVQLALDQGIDFLQKKYDVEWVFCMQQDIYPLEKNFFSNFEKVISNLKEKKLGAIGFNIISDDNVYMRPNIIQKYKNGDRPKGWLGLLPLSGPKKNSFFDLKFKNKIRYMIYKLSFWKKNKEKIKNIFLQNRIFCEYGLKNFSKYSKKYNGLCSIDIPMWGAIAINTKIWKRYITPRSDFIFHMWFNDIAFQMLKHNIWLAVHTELYLQNFQKIKEKYNLFWSSAHAGKIGRNRQVEKFGNHLKIFKKYWGFDYDNLLEEFEKVEKNYEKTLIDRYRLHDFRKGPLKTF